MSGTGASDGEGGVDVDEMDAFVEFAATVVQARFRGYQQRKRYLSQKHHAQEERTAAEQQDELRIMRELAAVILQRAWRGFDRRRTFAYYKTLVALRQQCDPKALLRHINPREAELVDAAAGVHVRLRLGGSCFPPLIFYKICTHRPIADIGAFGPRNYAAEGTTAASPLFRALPDTAPCPANVTSCSIQPLPRGGAGDAADFRIPDEYRWFVRRDGSMGERDTHGWYRRRENNGWRPVNEVRMLGGEEQLAGKRGAALAFHCKPAVRAEERQRRLKLRRRDWLVAMYRQAWKQEEGQCSSPPGEPDLWPDEELLEWSRGLDFGEYTAAWAATATTLSSTALVPLLEGSCLGMHTAASVSACA